MAIKNGDIVKVEYEGRFSNGEVFDSSERHEKPLEFQLGLGMLVPGFEKAVIGMEAGEEKEVTLNPSEAYGEINPEYVQEVPKDKFPPEAKEGMMIGLPMPDGYQIPATITKIGDETVTLDLNHPMAGKTLIFKIKVISFEESELPKEDHSCSCHSCSCDDDSCEDEEHSCSCC
ncbi:peptidylprolyl isomerase [archaeon]|nr:peptidylprolyl isomerase [archaeon]